MSRVTMKFPDGESTVEVPESKVDYLLSKGFTKNGKEPKLTKKTGGAGKASKLKKT